MTNSLSMFGDMKDYPGERKPALRDQPKVVAKRGNVATDDLPSWDTRPRRYKVKGVETEFFTRRHLAKALNRSSETIKRWQEEGLLPEATFRAPNLRQRDTPGTGDRLWTREQVLAIVRVAEVLGITRGKAPTPLFHEHVTQALIEVQREAKRNGTHT